MGKSKATVAKERKEKMRLRREKAAIACKGLAPQEEEKPLARRLASPSSASEKNPPNAPSSASSRGSLSIPCVDMPPSSDSLPRVCTPPRVPSPKLGVAGQTKLVKNTSDDVTSIKIDSKQKMHDTKLKLTDTTTETHTDTHTDTHTNTTTETSMSKVVYSEIQSRTSNHTLRASHGVVQGRFHQGNVRFGNNIGKQCVGNSLAAIVHSKLKLVDDWDPRDLDHILVVGDEIYTHIHANQNYLLVTELPEMVEIFDMLVKCERKESIMAIQAIPDGENFENYLALPLDQALQEALIDSDGCFICVMDNTFLIMKNNGKLYVFDSHARNRLGLQDPDGSSIVLQMQNIDEVYQHCLNLFPGTDNPHLMFEITGITISIDHTDSLDNDIQGNVARIIKRNPSSTLGRSTEMKQNEKSGRSESLCPEETDSKLNELHNDSITAEEQLPHTSIHHTDDLAQNLQTDDSDIEMTCEVASEVYDFRPLDIKSKKKLCSVMHIPSTYISKSKLLSIESMGAPTDTQFITGDGNCLFRALSFTISQRQKYHETVRKAIVNHSLQNAENFKSFLEPQYTSVQQYVSDKNMLGDGVWGTAMEIVAAADLLKTDIYTFLDGRWIRYSTTQVCSTNQVSTDKAIYLKHVADRNHYEVVNSVQCEDVNEVLFRKRNTPTKSAVVKKKLKLADEKETGFHQKVAQKRISEDILVDEQWIFDDQNNNESVAKLSKADKEKLKYHSCPEFKQQKIDKVKKVNQEKYVIDPSFRERKIEKSNTRYANCEHFRNKTIKAGVQKYATDDEYRKKLRKRSVKKYSSDEEFRKNVKQSSLDKYANDEEFRKNVNPYEMNIP